VDDDEPRTGPDRWLGRVDDPLDLEPTGWERLTKGPRMGYYSAFHTRGKAFTLGLLAAVGLFMGGILLIILFA
jgi:hypothetical protein